MYKKFKIIVEPSEEGGFYARIPDIPSIFTGGTTETEALKNAKAAIKKYFKICREDSLLVKRKGSTVKSANKETLELFRIPGFLNECREGLSEICMGGGKTLGEKVNLSRKRRKYGNSH